MTHALRAACLVLSLLWVKAAVAEPTVRDLAARTEVHPIQTLTVSVRQFLTGDQDGKPVTIAGHLRFPQVASGRVPAVILQHGSSGSNARDELWAKTFNEIGIATFLVDSFSGRGLVRTSTILGSSIRITSFSTPIAPSTCWRIIRESIRRGLQSWGFHWVVSRHSIRA